MRDNEIVGSVYFAAVVLEFVYVRVVCYKLDGDPFWPVCFSRPVLWLVDVAADVATETAEGVWLVYAGLCSEAKAFVRMNVHFPSKGRVRRV